MTDINWPRQLCPHCGNREGFEFEVTTTLQVPPPSCPDPEEALHNVELPFNSKVWCLKCGKQGRWNSWQRGAYVAAECAPRDYVQSDFIALGTNAHGRPEYRHEKTGIVFVECPAGSFEMGSDECAAERPPHQVTFEKPFLIAKYQVTQAQWEKVMGNNPSLKVGADHPVENVSWDECQEFCRRAGLSLPSESKWEYACRAGSQSRWCFGDDEARLTEYACYGKKWEEGHEAVGKRKSNAWGLHDMYGNVWEWCQDAWRDYEGTPTDGSARDIASGSGLRVLRGGSFFSFAEYCRSADRGGYAPGFRGRYLGVRPAGIQTRD